MKTNSVKKRDDMPVSAAVIVAHPDDETLWAGGMMLMHHDWQWFIAALCRRDDPDRAPKFFTVVEYLHASATMADLDDKPEQTPLAQSTVEQTILSALPVTDYDIILTHSPCGEYTRHIRHEETGKAVVSLWKTGEISAKELWLFAYEDDGKGSLPRAIETAHRKTELPEAIWQQKYAIIKELYGFTPDSFEAKTTPGEEAFWCFSTPEEVEEWIERGGAER